MVPSKHWLVDRDMLSIVVCVGLCPPLETLLEDWPG